MVSSHRRKPSIALFAVLCAAVLSVVPGGAPRAASSGRPAAVSYVGGIEDLPLMPGLTEQKTDRMIFDTPAGRIVEATAIGAVSKLAVQNFYMATLPQLGWRPVGPMMFEREGEQLIIKFPKVAAAPPGSALRALTGLTVSFTIRPQTATAPIAPTPKP